MKATMKIGMAALALLLVAGPAYGQGNVAVSVSVPTVLVLSTSGSFAFPAADDAAYTAGSLAATSGPSLTHRGNVPYQIRIQAQSGSSLSWAAAAGRSLLDTDPNKPTTHLELRATTDGTPGAFVGLAAAGGAATSLYSRSQRGNTLTSTVDAKLALSYANDPPGTYSTTVVFTIIAQ